MLGKDDSIDVRAHGLTYAVVMELMKGLEHKGHHVYMDNFFSSPDLFRDLKSLGIGACGTARVDRKGMPALFSSNLEKGKVRKRQLAGGVLALQWQDKNKVTMLSTIHQSGMTVVQRRSRHGQRGVEEIRKPTVVMQYNKFMGGVDQADQMLSYYGFTHRTAKWWRRTFFHLLNVSVLNAYIFHQQQEQKKCTHEQFRIELARQILQKYGGVTRMSPQSSQILPTLEQFRLTGRHFLERTP